MKRRSSSPSAGPSGAVQTLQSAVSADQAREIQVIADAESNSALLQITKAVGGNLQLIVTHGQQRDAKLACGSSFRGTFLTGIRVARRYCCPVDQPARLINNYPSDRPGSRRRLSEC